MEIIIAIIGTATTIITAILTNYFTKKNQLKFEEKQLKEKYYLEYIEAVSKSMNNINRNTDEILNENHAFNRLMLIGSEDTVNNLYQFQNFRTNYLNGEYFNELEQEYNRTLNNLIKSMRKDLYGKEDKKITSVYFLRCGYKI